MFPYVNKKLPEVFIFNDRKCLQFCKLVYKQMHVMAFYIKNYDFFEEELNCF